jgi:hypothetical protein
MVKSIDWALVAGDWARHAAQGQVAASIFGLVLQRFEVCARSVHAVCTHLECCAEMGFLQAGGTATPKALPPVVALVTMKAAPRSMLLSARRPLTWPFAGILESRFVRDR